MYKKFRIACIGSREITFEQSCLFGKVAQHIVRNGHNLSSGNAEGTDSSFARAANGINPERVILYLPWKTYNPQYIHPLNHVLHEPKSDWADLTASFHPGWQYLSRGAKLLMSRNYGIVHRADKVLAFLNHKKSGGGGTGQGVRIAKHLKIPVLDLNNKTYEQIIEFLGF